MTFSRRDFVKTSVLGAVAAGVGSAIPAEDSTLRRAGGAIRIVQAPDHHLRQQRLQLSRRRIRFPERRRRHARRRAARGQRTGRRSQRHQRRPRRTSQRRRRGRTRCLLHARTHAPRRLRRRRAQHQECLAGLEGRDGAHRPRHAGGRRRRALRGCAGLPAREPAHRTLPQNLAAVERISLQRRLVGTRIGRSALASPRPDSTRQAAIATLARALSQNLQATRRRARH